MTGRLVGFVYQYFQALVRPVKALYVSCLPPRRTQKITSSTLGINMAKPKEKFALTISPTGMSKSILQLVLILTFETVLIIIVLHGKQLFSIKMKNT